MAWKVTVTFEKEKDLLRFLASNPQGAYVLMEGATPPPKEETKATSIVGPDSYLSFGREPTGEKMQGLMKEFKKLESKHGAHKVTRKMLTDAIKKSKMPDWVWKSGVTTALREGYLEAS